MRDWSGHLSVLWILLIKHIPVCGSSKGCFLVCLLVEKHQISQCFLLEFWEIFGRSWWPPSPVIYREIKDQELLGSFPQHSSCNPLWARQMWAGNAVWKIICIRDTKTIKTREASGRERVCPGMFQLLMVHRRVLTGWCWGAQGLENILTLQELFILRWNKVQNLEIAKLQTNAQWQR